MAFDVMYLPSASLYGQALYQAGRQQGAYQRGKDLADYMLQSRSVGIEQQRAETERELGTRAADVQERAQDLAEQRAAVEEEMQRAAMALDYQRFEQLDKQRLALDQEIQKAQIELQTRTLEEYQLPELDIQRYQAEQQAAAALAGIKQQGWQLKQRYPYTSFMPMSAGGHEMAKQKYYAGAVPSYSTRAPWSTTY